MRHWKTMTRRSSALNRATLALLLIGLLSSSGYARSTPRLQDAPAADEKHALTPEEKRDLEDLCNRAAEEVVTSRKTIADQKEEIKNLKAQIKTLKALDTNSVDLDARYQEQIRLAEESIKRCRDIIAEQDQRISDLKDEIKKLRDQIDAGRWAWLKGAAVGVFVGALIVGTIWGATSSGN